MNKRTRPIAEMKNDGYSDTLYVCREDKTCQDCIHSGTDHYSGNLFCFIDDLEILVDNSEDCYNFDEGED